MNLVEDAWVNVLMSDGSAEYVSLEDAFRRGDDIVSLQGNIAERASLLSLLTSIAQRAMGVIRDERAWKNCRPDIKERSLAYLSKNKSRFNLFGSSPFYQAKAASSFTRNRTLKLSLERPDGDSHSFHDHEAAFCEPSNAELANMLVQVQLFNSGGLIQKPDLWTGAKITSAKPCPLSKKFLVIYEGECLLDTIWLHLASAVQVGNRKLDKPFWEQSFKTRQQWEDYVWLSYYGSLLPVPMAICLHDANEMSWTEVVQCPDMVHPMTIECMDKKNKKYQKLVSPSAAVWRQLGAALGTLAREPLAGAHAREYPGKLFVYAGGVPKDKAKQFAPVESVFCIGTGDGVEMWSRTYAEEFKYADMLAWCLRKALGSYVYWVLEGRCRASDSPQGEIPGLAVSAYWGRLQGSNGLLCEAAVGERQASERWRKRCYRTAKAIYDQFSPTKNTKTFKAYSKGVAAFEKEMMKGSEVTQ